jgi:hypothetical protein
VDIVQDVKEAKEKKVLWKVRAAKSLRADSLPQTTISDLLARQFPSVSLGQLSRRNGAIANQIRRRGSCAGGDLRSLLDTDSSD